MNNLEENSKIDRLNSALYSRETPNIMRGDRSKLHNTNIDVRDSWEEPKKKEEKVIPEDYYGKQGTKKRISIFKLFFLISAVFCLIAVSIAAYSFIKGGNTISAQNVDILISGPVSVPGGEKVSFDVQVYNKNSVALQTTDLKVEFPAGTAQPTNTEIELNRYQKMLGNINAGGVAKDTVSAVFFGEERSTKQIKITAEYRVPGTNAVLTKEKYYEFTIQSSPMNITVSSDSSVISGQEMAFEVKLTSNSQKVLKNVLLRTEYPTGFTYSNSSAKPLAGNNIWDFGDILPGTFKSIVIRGKVSGQDEDNKIFRFFTGGKSTKDEKVIGTPYIAAVQEVLIQKPFFSTSISIAGDASANDYNTEPGNRLTAILHYKNNLSVPITNAEIKLKFSGNAFVTDSIVSEDGVYRASDKTITWNRQTNRELSSIAAGDEGDLYFSISLANLGVGSSELVKNPEIDMTVDMNATRLSETKVPSNIVSSSFRRIKITPSIGVASQLVRSQGDFENSGPIPPKVDEKTTYTIIWTLTTTSSSINDVVVVGYLPSYVEWTDNATKNEEIDFNSAENKITWRVGKLQPYTGISSNKRTFAFQVAFRPTMGQVGDIPVLLNNVTLTGKDEFTGEEIKTSSPNLNTVYNTDPAFKNGDEYVTK